MRCIWRHHAVPLAKPVFVAEENNESTEAAAQRCLHDFQLAWVRWEVRSCFLKAWHRGDGMFARRQPHCPNASAKHRFDRSVKNLVTGDSIIDGLTKSMDIKADFFSGAIALLSICWANGSLMIVFLMQRYHAATHSTALYDADAVYAPLCFGRVGALCLGI